MWWSGLEWVDQGHGGHLGGCRRNVVWGDTGLGWDGRNGRAVSWCWCCSGWDEKSLGCPGSCTVLEGGWWAAGESGGAAGKRECAGRWEIATSLLLWPLAGDWLKAPRIQKAKEIVYEVHRDNLLVLRAEWRKVESVFVVTDENWPAQSASKTSRGNIQWAIAFVCLELREIVWVKVRSQWLQVEMQSIKVGCNPSSPRKSM